MAMLQAARAPLVSLLPTGDPGDDSDINKAIVDVDNALNGAYWIDGSHVNDKKPFDESEKALKNLDGLSVADPSVAVWLVVDAAENLAQVRLDEAIAADGNPADIAAAQAHMATAAGHVSAGEFDKAVKEYHKAWEDAEAAFP